MKNYTVYTANTGDYDTTRDDILCFKDYHRFISARMNAKIYKVLYYQFIQTEWSIWIDCNRFLKVSPEYLIELCGDKDICVFEHPDRNCIYEEADVCKYYRLDYNNIIDNQISKYQRLNYPKNNGLAACNLIIRRNTPEIKQLCDAWWSEINAGSWRDQISFPFVFNQSHNIKYLNKELANDIYYVKQPHKLKREIPHE